MRNDTSALNHSHQRGLFDPRYARPVNIIGVGSQGSASALAIAKMGVSDITVWDSDGVESENIPYSLYRPQDVGHYKVDVLQKIVEEQTGVIIRTMRKDYQGEPLRNTSVICSPDNMTTRRLVWDEIKNSPTVDLLIDTRTNAWYLEVYPIDPRKAADRKYYEESFFDDSEASRQSCGHHGHIAVAFAGAAIVTASLSTFWTNGTKKLPVRLRCDMLEAV